MAAIGLSYANVKSRLPATIDVACRNSHESCTISGPTADVTQFLTELKRDGIFAREVHCANIPFHSRYIAEMGDKLLRKLRTIIPAPKTRSDKWISSSVPACDWHLPSSKLSSAEYHTNNLLSTVLFEEAAEMLPSRAIVIEIAPHGLLQAIVKRSLTKSVHVPLMHRGHSNNAAHFLQALGK